MPVVSGIFQCLEDTAQSLVQIFLHNQAIAKSDNHSFKFRESLPRHFHLGVRARACSLGLGPPSERCQWGHLVLFRMASRYRLHRSRSRPELPRKWPRMTRKPLCPHRLNSRDISVCWSTLASIRAAHRSHKPVFSCSL